MKKSLFLVVVSFCLLGLFAFAKEGNEWSNHRESSVRTGTQFTGNHTWDRLRTGVQFTWLSASGIACVKLAITTRDALISSWMTTYATTWTTTFAARTNALVAALSLTTQKQMKTAMDLAIKTSEKTMNSAQKTKKNTIQNAWNAYRTSLKACNVGIAKDLMLEKWEHDLND